jgi:flagella basal body P-ring formation protein FlgA
MRNILRIHADEITLGIRIALLILGVSIGTVFLIVGAKKAMAATLRSDTIITGDYIRLGDVFDGVKNAEYVLGPAPQPGKEMVLNARTLYKIAAALDVDWQPSSNTEQLILRREAAIIPQAELTSALEEKVRENGVDQSFSLSFNSALTDLVLPAGMEEKVEVTAFTFDPQTDLFRATLAAPSAENPVKTMNVSGRVERLVAVPVLKNTLKNGDIIGTMDLDYVEMPKNKIASGVVVNEKDLVNMSPRRMIAGGKPVQLNDLERPRMVDRGDNITLVFANGPIILTAKGKSLQTGALGDTVRVSNMDSNKNLQGTVTAHREVTVR